MATIYEVILDMKTRGQLGAQLGDAGPKAEKVDKHIAGIKTGLAGLGNVAVGAGAKLAGMFTGAVERVGELGLKVGVLAGAAGLGALGYSITKINQELENSQIGIASILRANDQANSFPEAMKQSADLMKQIRLDARALPGEVSDLIQIFQSIAIPGFQGGKGANDIRNLSSQFMAFGLGVARLRGEVVAREAAMLLEGRAGARNVLGMKLAGLGGDKAQEFNQMTTSQRFDFLSKALAKHSEAFDAFQHSYAGLSSTLVDNVKNFGRLATAGLFGRIKDSLEGANGWFDRNQERIGEWADKIGDYLVRAFDYGKEKIEEWGPRFITFGENAFARLKQLWEELEPTVARVAGVLERTLADPSTIDRLGDVAKAYGAIKVGTAIGPGALSAAGSLGEVLGGGLGIGGAATGGLGLAALAAVALVAEGAIHDLTDETSYFHAMVKDDVTTTMKNLTFSTERFSAALGDLGPVMQDSLDFIGAIGADAMATVSDRLRTFADAFEYFADKVNKGQSLVKAGLGIMQSDKEWEDKILAGQRGDTVGNFGVGLGGHGVKITDAIAAGVRKGQGGGGGGTTVQKVEIVVNQNQDPLRVARAVIAEVQNIHRHPRVARNAPNFSR